MIILDENLGPFRALQVWWPESAEQVHQLLSAATIVTVMQCNHTVAEPLRTYAFRWRPFHTLKLDLTLPEEMLWRGVRTKYLVNRARRIDCRMSVNEDDQEALGLINSFIRRKRFRPLVSEVEWSRLRRHSDVFLVAHEGRAVAAQVVLAHPPEQARLLFDATLDRQDAEKHQIIGALHAALFWFVITHYRTRRFLLYDMGGIVLDKAHPHYSITHFKRSFGGTVATEHILRLTGNPVLRSVLRGVLSARRFWASTTGKVTEWRTAIS